MDEVALSFAQTAMAQTVRNCDDLEALKELALALIGAHYAQRRMLGELILQDVPRLDQPSGNS